MVTGGFKGRKMSVSEIEMEDALRALFPNARIVGEYGMTELSSQLWSVPLGGPFVLPPWMKAVAVDPATGTPAPTGLLRFFDLSNHQTVMAIETMDVGTIHPGGRVTLHGRLPGAIARGCSLTVEDIINPPTPTRPLPTPAFAPCAPTTGPEWQNDLDRARTSQVLRALQDLRQQDAQPLSDGLSAANAQQCLHNSIDAITVAGLQEELATPGTRPQRVSVICARGVFTAPLEWVSLLAAAGCNVHIKAPTSAPDFVFAMADALAAQGLPVHASTSRDLMEPDAILAFGTDETMLDLHRKYPKKRLALYGHRFSIAWIRKSSVTDLMDDIILYDGRGCMAPAAIFTDADPLQLANTIAQKLETIAKTCPRGAFDPALGPEWRRRMGLAATTGHVIEGSEWAVLISDARNFTPMALPRMVVIHPVDSIGELHERLSPWRNHFSSLGTDDRTETNNPDFQEICGWFPRISRPGQLQRPPFPRKHDGRPVLGSLLQSEASEL